MKIAHVVDSMEIGGVETLVSQMCRLQRKQGHDSCILAIQVLGPLGEQMLAEGIPVHANLGPHLAASLRSFVRVFRQMHPNVVHLHNPGPTVYAAWSARITGVSRILSTRHSLVAPPHRVMEEMKYAVAATCCNWAAGVCDATTDNLKRLHGVPASKIVRVYNGVDPIRKSAGENWPAKTGFTLAFVGRLAPVKNHSLLFHAFRTALAAMPNLRLWMIGDGSERGTLERMAADLGIYSQTTFWGQQLDVAPFFSAADAFIMSSRLEGLPVSLLQAFSVGLPAIVTDVGGIAEVFDWGTPAWWFQRKIRRQWRKPFCTWHPMKQSASSSSKSLDTGFWKLPRPVTSTKSAKCFTSIGNTKNASLRR